MRDLDKLIDYYNRRVEMYTKQATKKEKEVDKAYNDGIAEVFMLAVKELEKVNKLIDEKLKALL